MRTLSGISRRHGLLILDTGPIRELVLFHAVSEFRLENLRRSLRFIKDDRSYKSCSEYVASFRQMTTTSASVVVELYHWIRETEPYGQSKLWRRVYEEFQNMGMDEEVVKLLDMDASFVMRFGPVDGSLLELARRHTSRNPVILTADSPLYGECKKGGLSVSHIDEVTVGKP
jgi:hypothetical protein